MTHATYPLRTISDFLAIPPERIPACLEQFAVWLQLVHDNPDAGIVTDVVEWKDDDADELVIVVEV